MSESHVPRPCTFWLNTDRNPVQIKLNFWNWKTFSLFCFWKALESYLEIINFEWISPKSWFSSPLKSRSQIYPQIKTTIIDSQPTHHYRKRFHKIIEENGLFDGLFSMKIISKMKAVKSYKTTPQHRAGSRRLPISDFKKRYCSERYWGSGNFAIVYFLWDWQG